MPIVQVIVKEIKLQVKVKLKLVKWGKNCSIIRPIQNLEF